MLRNIPGYEDYLINESGAIIDKNKNLLRISTNKYGYLYVTIDDNIELVHELVARTYLNKDDIFMYPAHRDGDILNNHLSNLYMSNKPEVVDRNPYKPTKKYSSSTNTYIVYNPDTNDEVICIGRGEVVELIEYAEISLKNMVGNGRVISLGPYKGYQIRRVIDNKE